ncbi:MAG: pyruvate, phosphate dikinase, partial [Acidobacteria bacterium]|nr:pyruvate, phosphate dikinase [Acidobacteriota bacterium]
DKCVYFFGGGKADGHGDMKDVLGGKGAGLAEMTNAGLPVPSGFTVATSACRLYFQAGNKTPDNIKSEAFEHLAKLESLLGQKLGDTKNPLLLSVRSGAKFSMPGMMDTILNLGMNDAIADVFAKKTANPRFAYDSYRRFIQMFGNVVMEIPKEKFEHVFDGQKKKKRIKLDTELTAEDLKEVIADYKKVVRKEAGKDFPQDPKVQLEMAIEAVFRSWYNPRAKTYRRMNKISDDLGTAVNVQTMVFGNMGDTSGTGVGFTRNPATGEKEFYGEFLMNAQGEDVVSGARTPVPIKRLEEAMPEVYNQLREITTRLENHYRDVQDFEFTIQDGKLYMLQTRNGKRTGIAAVRIALDMVDEGMITQEEAVLRVEPEQLNHFLVPRLDESQPLKVLGKGLAASPGGAVGRIVFSAEEAVKQGKHHPVILVRGETVPDDIHGMEVAVGILTSRGGMTSHAAVVTRGMGKSCVAGCSDAQVDENANRLKIGSATFKEGDWLSLDGTTGRVIEGRTPLLDPDPNNPNLLRFMEWADEYRKLGVRANADIPRDALKAREYGAEGIGLCRTEHMFFAKERLPHVQRMIMACKDARTPGEIKVDIEKEKDAKRLSALKKESREAVRYEKQRRQALAKILPMQRKDFFGLFKAMKGLPVTIRTLDPPLHEFLPKREELMVEIAKLEASRKKSPKLSQLKRLLDVVEGLHEFNPMLGLRGCRLGIMYPEITEMQARAIFEAAADCKRQGIEAKPEVMIPLVGEVKELQAQKEIVVRVAEEVFKRKGVKVDYLVGTMIELPAAALSAAEIAQEAEFFSFGTNDLTQTTFGLSRDDCGKIINAYTKQKIWPADPFAQLDPKRVGRLLKIATSEGREGRSNLKVGICGEHGGDPSSIEICADAGLNYVSCSPYRVPIARLAAAQSAVKKAAAKAYSTA